MVKRNTKRKNYRKGRKTVKGGMDPLPNNNQIMAPVFDNGVEIPDIPHENENWGDWGDELNISQDSSNPDTTYDSGLTANMEDLFANNNDSFSSFGTDPSLDQSLSTISRNSDDSMMSVGSNLFDDENDENPINGGKRKRRRKSNKRRKQVKKGRKTRKNKRKQRGGMCYGNGVGANSYDPNYSIYNTNLTKLFPYKPN